MVVVEEGGAEEVVVETSEDGAEVEDEGAGGEGGAGGEVLEDADVLEEEVGVAGDGGGADCGEDVVGPGGAGGAVSGAVEAVSGKETAEVDVPEREVCCGAEAARVEVVEPASVKVPHETAVDVRTSARTPPSSLRKTARGRLEIGVSSKTLVLELPSEWHGDGVPAPRPTSRHRVRKLR